MKANELRIGNYVSLATNNDDEFNLYNFLIVEDIGKDNLTCIFNNDELEMYYEDIEPILITEEWVLNFGFEKVNGSDCYFKLQIQKELGGGNPEFDIWVDFGEEDVDGRLPMVIQIVGGDSEWLRTDIKYIHQLQNLYFALTGKELIRK